MNSVTMMLVYAGKMIAVLLLVFLLAVLTPKLARSLRKGKGKAGGTGGADDIESGEASLEALETKPPVEQMVRGLYDAQTPEVSESTNENKREEEN